MNYTFWQPNRIRDSWRKFVDHITGREDYRTIERLRCELTRANEDVRKGVERIRAQGESNEDLRKRLNEISSSQIRLAQDNAKLAEQLQHAEVALKLYAAAADVMSKAQSEVYRIR